MTAADGGARTARFIDVHYHCGPDAYVRRRTATTAAAAYAEHGGWVVPLFDRFPGLALPVQPSALERQPFPGAWRLKSLPVRL